MYKITKRDLTLQDFLKLKKSKYFKDKRQTGKTLNLALLFNCSGPTVGRQLKKGGFTEEDCDDALDTLNLNSVYNQALLNDKKGDPVALKYVIIGNKMRELYFKAYPGLLRRVEREQKFAIKHGYVRSWVGPVRHIPEFRFMNVNKAGNLCGADQKLYSKMFANLKNTASNTSIQTAEVYHAMPDVYAAHVLMKQWGMKSCIWNYVHDSICMYIYKPEKNLVYAIMNKLANENREPYYDIPMQIDVEESDLLKDQYYGSGDERSLSDYDLDTELAKWNKEHGTNYEYACLIPR